MFVPISRPPPPLFGGDNYLGALIERFERSARSHHAQTRLSIGEIASKYRGRRDWTDSADSTMPSMPTQTSGSDTQTADTQTADTEVARYVRIAPQDLDPAQKRTAEDKLTDTDLMPWLTRPRTPGRPWDADSDSSECIAEMPTLAAPVPSSPEHHDSPTGFRRPRLGRRFESKSEPSGPGSPQDAGEIDNVSPFGNINGPEAPETMVRRVSAPPSKLVVNLPRAVTSALPALDVTSAPANQDNASQEPGRCPEPTELSPVDDAAEHKDETADVIFDAQTHVSESPQFQPVSTQQQENRPPINPSQIPVPSGPRAGTTTRGNHKGRGRFRKRKNAGASGRGGAAATSSG
jgi:hypothetical protein